MQNDLLDRKLSAAASFLDEAWDMYTLRNRPLDSSEAGWLRVLAQKLQRLQSARRLPEPFQGSQDLPRMNRKFHP